MPTANAYRRAPLVDPAYVTLSDAAVHAGGLIQTLIDRALELLSPERMSALDSVLATKLGGYAQTPPMPDLEAAKAQSPREYVRTLRAAAMIAAMNRDKDGMLSVLTAVRGVMELLPKWTEAALFEAGADLLRLVVDLYRRTGQPFLLQLMEELRSRLPDVSGVMHSFPFQGEYQPENGARTQQEKEYYDRMARFATGTLMADSLAMTALLAQYSGSGRDAASAKTGLNALDRYHGMPAGVFSADPYLAGRDPARAAELTAVCAQAEAYADALCFSGDADLARRIEMLLVNVLPDLLTEKGLRGLAPTNRLSDDDSCETVTPENEDVSALLRALHAIRRSVWLSRDEETIAYALPVSGGCVTRLGGVPVRLSAEVSGVFEKKTVIRVECRQPVTGCLRLRIPVWAKDAQLTVNGSQAPLHPKDGWQDVKRLFHNGDLITLTYTAAPRMENGARGSVSVYVGSQLMALSLPQKDVAWRYAVMRSLPVTSVEDDGVPYALITAGEAPEWKEKAGFIQPPPQGVKPGAAYELTLIPFAGTGGRIAAFPCVMER